MIQMPNAYLPAVQFEAIVITIWKFASIWEVGSKYKCETYRLHSHSKYIYFFHTFPSHIVYKQ